MSLMKTLAKVAIGVAVAKGVNSMMKGGSASAGGGGGMFGGGGGGGGLEDLVGSVLGGARSPSLPSSGSGAAMQADSGGLGGMLGGLAKGGGGGLGDLLNQLGGAGGAGGAGGLQDLIGSLGAGGAAGGLGGLLGQLAGTGGGRGTGGTTFGDKLNQAFRGSGEPAEPPTPQEDAAAGLMLRAMIQAAKSDGKLDEAERRKLLDNLGEVGPQERAFVTEEMAAPVDVEGLARQVPRGLETQVYVMSLLGIDLDNRAEAQYLHQLAGAMGVDPEEVNAIHDKLGQPRIYG